MEKVSSDLILEHLKSLVESKIPIAREAWLDVAFKLNLLKLDETKLFNKMRQEVAKKKLAILRAQDKKNVSAATLELESTDEYRFMRDQEDKIEAIEEFVRIAKKNADLNF